MERTLNIKLNLQDYSVSLNGDTDFYYGDNNKIYIALSDNSEDYTVSMSALVTGAGTYVAELIKQKDGTFLLDNSNRDFDSFLVKIGKIQCNIHIFKAGEKVTTFPLFINSLYSPDRDDSTILVPTLNKTVEDLNNAVDDVNDLDIDKITEAAEIIDNIDKDKIEKIEESIVELDETLDASKIIEKELQDTVTDVNTKLKNGDFNGRDGTGKDGRGITNIVIDSNYDMIVYYTDNTSQNLGNVRGPIGPSGAPGKDGESITGPAGADGSDGKSLEFIWNGSILGIRQEGQTIYSYQNLKGEKGDSGESIVGPSGENGKSIEFEWNGTSLGIRQEGDASYIYTDLKGEKGDSITGPAGTDGFSPVVSSIPTVNGTDVAIQDATHTEIFSILNGLDGKDGQDGKSITGPSGADGFSPIVSSVENVNGVDVFIQDATHTESFSIKNGKDGESITGPAGPAGADGKDYILTDLDKTAIATEAAGMIDVDAIEAEAELNIKTYVDNYILGGVF